ncbi:MAG: 2-oxoacid:ferredoxin oxidoreductase subunit beta, partial [Thermoanaerobaculia bacterium]
QSIQLEHGQPLVFGKDKSLGIRMNCTQPEVVELGDGLGPDDCLTWDAHDPSPALAFLVAQLSPPDFPTPIGVFRSVSRPAYELASVAQVEELTEQRGEGTLQDLIYSGEAWTVRQDGTVVSGVEEA